jgi:hypothetical protein
MFDPVRIYFDAVYYPSEDFNPLDEEQHAQRYGQVVGLPLPSLGRKFTLQLGKLFIRIGEKLTGECASVTLSREIT